MPEEKYKLNQVSVRLKLSEETPLYSTEQINSPRRAIDVMKDMMRQLDREYVCIVNLDNGNRPINFNIVSIGSINASLVTMRELLKSSILSNAASLIMLHSHPSYRTEKPVPSKEDNITTLNVMMATDLMGITLQDHVVVSGGSGSIYSYRAELKDKFSVEGLQEIIGLTKAAPVLAEEQTVYEIHDTEVSDLGPKRVIEYRETEDQPNEGSEIVDSFRAETEKKFNMIGGMDSGKVEAYIKDTAEKIFSDYGIEAETTEVIITGSRCRGLEMNGSDLDIVLEYKGEEPKEVVAAVLNDEKSVIGGVRVDIIPLQKDKDESLENYLLKEMEKLREAEKDFAERKAVEKFSERPKLGKNRPKRKEERSSLREKLRVRKAAYDVNFRQKKITDQHHKTERSV